MDRQEYRRLATLWDAMFEEYIARWELTRDGAPIITRSSRLLPVRHEGRPAMLKIAVESEEKFGGLLMVWWDGDGAARVLEHDGDTLLLERATGEGSLIEMARDGRDDEATRILCRVASDLHTPRDRPLPELIPLPKWFEQLAPGAGKHGGILHRSAEAAKMLLDDPQDVGVLHGDIHHGNVLDFGRRGWLAIDPKRLVGERGFDFANIFCNPDKQVATAPGCLQRRVEVVAEAAGIDRTRLLKWVLAWAGLSAVWFIGDGESPELDLIVAEIAAAELGKE